ncbi:acyl carrier protein [Pontibacter mangrovi]|uniref:Acyl carrier protein n=1 Tax=Pontibacter mangrovi TaxID=2589816 RepID=A0A501WEI6_9BACT|nr:acyl carrier protein [Pontibacter mangrovi]TPE45337.1 acyl carrier protein [Pontibacter mangrovi]
MIATNTAIEREVIRIISKTKEIKADRLWADRLLQDFGFDMVDVVDIILELEKSFQIIIPDEVQIDKVRDFVDAVALHALSPAE